MKITKKMINTALNNYMELCKNEVTFEVYDSKNPDVLIFEAVVKTKLTIDEKSAFINRIVDNVFDSEGNYLPEMYNPMFEITVLQMFTNIPVFEMNSQDGESKVVDIQRTYDLCKAIDLIGSIKDESFVETINSLNQMTVAKLDYEKERKLRAEEAKYNKLRNELEDGITMISAAGDGLADKISQLGSIEPLAAIGENIDYDKLVNSVLAQA